MEVEEWEELYKQETGRDYKCYANGDYNFGFIKWLVKEIEEAYHQGYIDHVNGKRFKGYNLDRRNKKDDGKENTR